MPVQTSLRLRRGTAAQWTSANPVLSDGEPGVESDTGNIKVGDGTTAWSSLSYALSSRYVAKADDRIFITPGEFNVVNTATNGAMTMASYTLSALLFDASTTEAAAASAYLPSHWTTFHIDFYWSHTSSTASGNVLWYLFRNSTADGGNLDTATQHYVTVAAPSEDTLKITRMVTSASDTSGRMFSLYVGRFASDGADTFNADAALLGVALVRAS